MGRSRDKLEVSMLVFFLLIGILLSPSHSLASGYQEKKLFHVDAYDVSEIKSLIDTTHKRIKSLEEQIISNKKDVDWLIFKINRITDSGRHPLSVLEETVTIKEKKIKALEKEKNRLVGLNGFYQKEYEKRHKMEVDANSRQGTGTLKTDENPPGANPKDIPGPSVQLSGIEAEIKKRGLTDWVEVTGDNTCLRLNTLLPILFSSGSAVVAKEYKEFLKKLALFLKPYDIKVVVSGFADTDPIHTKQYPSNLELGAARAASIVHELVKYGLKPSIFQIGTTGEYRFSAQRPIKQKSFHRRAQVAVIFAG